MEIGVFSSTETEVDDFFIDGNGSWWLFHRRKRKWSIQMFHWKSCDLISILIHFRDILCWNNKQI